jgi:tRNA-2-methylthio-N6-dimethylallyladenosine synthase
MPLTYFFETYGCQMNKAESSAIEGLFIERGWEGASGPEDADMVVINTCSVRITAENRIWGRLGYFTALKKRRPLTLVVTGCMAERLKAGLKKRVPAVDYVVGTYQKAEFAGLIDSVQSESRLEAIPEEPVFSFSRSYHEKGQFRSFLPIMHGCDNYCSYCIVPYVRGREISRDPEAILAEMRDLASKGVREVTLLGQNVNSYRWEANGPALDFPRLLERIAAEAPSDLWIRFLTSHPKDFSDGLLAVLKANPVFCRHIHLCVQHGSNRILSAMNRKYTREGYLSLVDRIRHVLPDASLSTDILIGFPGEEEADVDQTLDLMRTVGFEFAYMYHFNPREGTAAFSLPDRVPDEVKKERLARVIELQKEITRNLMRARVGGRARILVESVSKNRTNELLGRTERDEMVVFPGGPEMIGRFADVSLESLRGHTFRAAGAVAI